MTRVYHLLSELNRTRFLPLNIYHFIVNYLVMNSNFRFQIMDGRLLLLLLVSVCSPVLGDGYHCSDEKVDVKCPECQPIRPMKDFDEEKVNNN